MEKIIFIAVIYFLSHCFRVLRLAFLTVEDKVRFRSLFQAHFYTAALSYVLPFKLGEIIRVLTFGHLLNKSSKAVIIVWIERMYDALVIGAILGAVMVFAPDLISSYHFLITLLFTFVLMSILIFFLLPENLSLLKTILIVRYQSAWAVKVLKLCSQIEGLVKLAPAILKNRLLTLFLLTFCIWLSEVFAFSLVFTHASWMTNALSAMMKLPGILTHNFGFNSEGDAYTLVILSLLFTIGIICFYFYRLGDNRG